jgi:hypothetical protein
LTPEGLRSGLAELFDPAVGGKIKVTIGATYPMEKAGAHRALEKQPGKLALNRHSDKEKFLRDLNRAESCEMSERSLKILRKSGDSEYEGSIPFTRSIPPLPPA